MKRPSCLGDINTTSVVKTSSVVDYSSSDMGGDGGGSGNCDGCFGLSSSLGINRKQQEKIPMKTNPDVNIAEELQRLSVDERNEVYEDIHGVGRPIPETPELIHRSLAGMQNELDKRRNKPSYDLALQRNRLYVENPKLRLVFLRCDRFDCKEAAERYINYYDLVHHLFGEDVLGRDILLSDLGPKEIKALQAGHIQFLPQRDTAGRAIQFLDPMKLMDIYSSELAKEEIHTRGCLYIVMRTMLDSIETQRNGVVSVVYGVDTRIKNRSEFKIPMRTRFLQTVGRCFRSVPMRVNSFHFLSNDIRLSSFMFVFQIALTSAIRCRFQTHFGTAVECKYALLTFGIPVDSIPTDQEGVITYTKHQREMKKYQTKEAALKRSQGNCGDCYWDKAVFLPNRNDVLLGRGRPFQDHFGNVRMRAMIADCWEEYDFTKNRGGKAAIAQKIVEHIQHSGGQFLKIDPKTLWWVPVPDKDANGRVCQGFRKKREMDLAAGTLMRKKEVQCSSKLRGVERTKKVQRLVSDDDDVQSSQKSTVLNKDSDTCMEDSIDPAVECTRDSLSPEELVYLIDDAQQPLDTPNFTRNNDVQDLSSESKLEPIPYTEDVDTRWQPKKFEISTLLSVLSPSGGGGGGGDASKTDDPLLRFLESQRDAFKCSPQESFDWLRSQDIMTLSDLRDACGDEDFVELELKQKGGLKGYKRHPFIKAVASIA